MAEELAELTLAGLHESLAETILQIPGVNRQTSVLDLGCGSGAWLARLARLGFTSLRGVDSGSMVPMTPSSAYVCSQADLDDPDLRLGDVKFGLITAIEVIEHVENPGHLLAHVRRYLACDGYLLLTTPNVHSVRARVRFAITGKLAGFDRTNVPFEPTHIYPVFITCLDRLLPRYGLETVRRWTYPPVGGSGSRLAPRIVAALCARVLPNEYPGDLLCILIRHMKSQAG
jgi:2-polyprenyl-3-methyl-5-hydroxy-6-metoxy-1,4-benzoquinol methylase